MRLSGLSLPDNLSFIIGVHYDRVDLYEMGILLIQTYFLDPIIQKNSSVEHDYEHAVNIIHDIALY